MLHRPWKLHRKKEIPINTDSSLISFISSFLCGRLTGRSSQGGGFKQTGCVQNMSYFYGATDRVRASGNCGHVALRVTDAGSFKKYTYIFKDVCTTLLASEKGGKE